METRETETAEVIYELKQIACELNVPVVLLSGLSHSVDQKRNHRPTLSDFGDLENYLQEIDVVMFPYRDEYYNSDSEDKGIFEVNVAKQKNGPTGMVRLGWLKEYTKIINLRG